MIHWLITGGMLILLTSCTPKDLPLPDVAAVPAPSAEDLATFQAPSLALPPVVPTPEPPPPRTPCRQK